MPLAAIIFDVEGTLVDCVPHVLDSWKQTLEGAGHDIALAELQRYSGMDGADMLERLLPDQSKKHKKGLLKAQGDRYRRDYLALARPFYGVRELFKTLKQRGFALGIATTCKKDELRSYDHSMRVLELTDAVACGNDVEKGKPHPDLYHAALQKLGVMEPGTATAVGDTPYDAMAATALGMQATGVLTGGFSERVLKDTGCDLVLEEVRELAERIGLPRSET